MLQLPHLGCGTFGLLAESSELVPRFHYTWAPVRTICVHMWPWLPCIRHNNSTRSLTMETNVPTIHDVSDVPTIHGVNIEWKYLKVAQYSFRRCAKGLQAGAKAQELAQGPDLGQGPAEVNFGTYATHFADSIAALKLPFAGSGVSKHPHPVAGVWGPPAPQNPTNQKWDEPEINRIRNECFVFFVLFVYMPLRGPTVDLIN